MNMALRTFGGGPADVTSDATGQVVAGISLQVFTAAVGGQRVTELYDINGTPLPGVVTSSTEAGKLGRIEFSAAEDYSVLFLDPGYGMRWVVPAREAFNLTTQAVAKAEQAIALAENAVTHPQLDAVFLNPSTFPTVYPHQFGAKGDGATDDTIAVQAAVDYLNARGGGVLSYDPSVGSGFYQQHDIQLGPNITVEGNGCRIRARGYACFHAGSGTKKGYGAYTKNLVFRNLVFQGDFDTLRDCALTFHHTENVLFENCTWIEAMGSGHCLDLCGVKNVTFRSCKFLGYRYAGRDHAEAIQIDHSTANGLDNKDPAGTYDGLPCVNITVQDCVFDQLVKGSTTYEAPTPFGNHVHMLQLHQNLRFIGNYVRGAHYVSAQANANGWLHTYGVDGFEVSGNTFESTGASMIVIRVRTQTTGILPINYESQTGPTSSEIGAVPSRRIRISGNAFKGFASDANTLPLIKIDGLSGAPVTDVAVEGNTFTDCYPEARKATGGNYGPDTIALSYVSGVIVRGNSFRHVRRLVLLSVCDNVTVEANTAADVYWSAIILDTSGRNHVLRGNTLERYVVGISVVGVVNCVVQGNTLKDSRNATGLWTGYDAPIRFSAGARGSVIGNIVESTTPPAFQAAQAIKFTGTHTGGLYGSNLQSGHTKEATVDTGSTVTAK
ncbi:tailspike protein [Brevibacterium phage AGM7]|uniref:Tailspike protein n=1 Tax=Brevibacterium phage AGM7 TaxID=2591424 RepID=A0A7D0KVH3_9CAUD|nr:tailspike protein [Brevibacterium phage AGM7]